MEGRGAGATRMTRPQRPAAPPRNSPRYAFLSLSLTCSRSAPPRPLILSQLTHSWLNPALPAQRSTVLGIYPLRFFTSSNRRPPPPLPCTRPSDPAPIFFKYLHIMGGSSKVMDGSNIKSLVNDPLAFSHYVDAKFRTLDTSHNDRLSRQQLLPIALAIGNALGLPPKGSSPETDHIYDEVLGEFLQGKKESITKEEFTPILRDMLLGVADGLERDPVVLRTVTGSDLEEYAKSNQFEVDAVGVFTQLEKGTEGKIPGSALEQALEKVSLEQGMPPASHDKIKKDIVEPALQSVGIDKSRDLSQEEFIAAYRQSLLSIASHMKQKPVTVAHTEKSFDGSSISTFLKDESVLQQTLDDTWISLGPFKAADDTFPKNNLRLGLDLLAPLVGLPPVGSVDEMDHVVDESLKLVDSEKGGFVDKEGFCKSMLEVLGGIMLQLQGKPISVSLSVPVVASDSNPDDCLKL